MVITGEVGAGKTTIIRKFIRNAGEDMVVGVVNNPSPVSTSALDRVLSAFDIIPAAGETHTQWYDRFVQFLLQHYAEGRRVALVVDEAQNLRIEALEELRMLSNVNNEKDQLLQIILLGQPELLHTLQRTEMRQLKQRISVHCHLDALSAAETAAYIRFRLSVVGGDPDIFDDITCANIYYFTGGVPRLINLLCDQVLVYAFSEDLQNVKPDTVLEVVGDRERSGLSAWRNLPTTIDMSAYNNELKLHLREIQEESSKGTS